MKPVVFLTGATGFLGASLLPRLREKDRWHYRVLARSPEALEGAPDGVEVIPGDLADPASYRRALEGVQTVVHLAAMTGKASAATHDRLNRKATEDLIAGSQAAGVQNFLFVSTIAAGFSDKAFYPYASAKLEAEKTLAASGLRFAILRPTLIFGPESPLWDALGTLAKLPAIPLPGRRDPAIVQPIALGDVCRGIAEVLERGAFSNEILDLGGPDKLSMENLLRKIARARFGRDSRVLKLPLRLVQWPLAALEPLARPLMPATAGQFAVFGNDSTCRPNWLMDALEPDMTPLDRMVHELSDTDRDDTGQPAPTDGPVTSKAQAEIEARRLGRHMAGQVPSEAAVAHYVRALGKLSLDDERTLFDQAALRRARAGGLGFWLIDAFAGLADRRGVLRRRQQLLAAILENEAATHHAFDDTPDSGAAAAILRLFATGAVATLLTLAALVLFLPYRAWLARKTQAQA